MTKDTEFVNESALDTFMSTPRDEVGMRVAGLIPDKWVLTLNNISLTCVSKKDGEEEMKGSLELVFTGDGVSDTKQVSLGKTAGGLKWETKESVDVSEYGEELAITVRSEHLREIGSFVLPLGVMGAALDVSKPEEFTVHEMETESEGRQLKLTVRVSNFDISIPDTLEVLCRLFCQIFDRTGDVNDMDYAITYRTRLFTIPFGGVAFQNLRVLSVLYGARFRKSGEARDAEKAIQSQRRALDFLPEGHPDQAHMTGALARAYCGLYEATKKPADIEKGLSLHKQATEMTQRRDGHLLQGLALALRDQFENTGKPSTLDECISTFREVSELPTAPDDEETVLPGRLTELARALERRFRSTSHIPDINDAITASRRAISLLDDNHPKQSALLVDLGALLQRRFKGLGELRDLEEALHALRRAVSLVPDGHEYLPVMLNNLGGALQLHFERTRNEPELQEAIVHQRRSIELTAPEDHSDLAARLNNLGIFLQMQFEETGDLEIAREGVSAQERAVELTPDDSPVLPTRTGALMNAFNSICARTQILEDSDRAVEYAERALTLHPANHPDLHITLYNAGLCWQRRYNITHDAETHDRAISLLRRALELTPSGYAGRILRLLNLGLALIDRHKLNADGDILQEAQSYFVEAATSNAGQPRARLQAAKNWIGVAEQQQDRVSAIAAYDVTIGLISVIAGLEQTVENRHKNLGDLSTLSLQAAATAFEMDRADKALEWLEQGRCLVWRQLNSLRTPLDDLRLHDENLAERVLSVSRRLDSAGSRTRGGEDSRNTEAVADQGEVFEHVQLAADWEALLRTVRATPGFEDFLQPPSSASILENLPEGGPVVVINVHERRCDAIALMVDCEPLHIPLPDFSFKKAESHRKLLDRHLQRFGARSATKFPQDGQSDSDDEGTNRSIKPLKRRKVNNICAILEDLWTHLVEPILSALAFFPSDNPGRIWWCPTGPLTFLPIHAAGIYTSGQKTSLSDYAVSSYAPTVSSLTSIPRSRPKLETIIPGIALIGISGAVGGLPEIPGAATEVANIQRQAAAHGIPTSRLEGEQATVEATMRRMESHSCIHLACHAEQDASDPLQSGFLLHDGRLSLSNIMKNNLKHAELAFLSACQTSAGHNALSEEAVHLAGGMIAAGYRGVIATMWSIPDLHAPVVAHAFYEDLLGKWDDKDNDGRPFDGARAAYALHHSLKALREQLGTSAASYISWVPYIHFGA